MFTLIIPIGCLPVQHVQDPAQAEPDLCHNQELRGLMNITGPQAAGWDGPANATGPAVFVSMPMFCGADDRLAQQVEGLQCDWQRHITWVDVEPTTGEGDC
eukprot:GHRQ01037997.1.p5 GENE.GHRQ01037997.1~~GHRQ01037997.1.p5  ORF type:complete len:101 (-),score=30.95 GHRQ01037997.1:539-841(-)